MANFLLIDIVATYQAVLGSLSSSIVGRPEFENLMRQESASALFDKKVSEEEFLDSEAMELEMEISNLLLSYRPLKQVIVKKHIPVKFHASC